MTNRIAPLIRRFGRNELALTAHVIAATALACSFAFATPASAQDAGALETRISQLESELGKLQARVDAFGSATTSRTILSTNPVFMGAGVADPGSLGMDDARINCPPRSYVAAIQVLKTGNTVSQIRYACREF